jgi:hypothetical protein
VLLLLVKLIPDLLDFFSCSSKFIALVRDFIGSQLIMRGRLTNVRIPNIWRRRASQIFLTRGHLGSLVHGVSHMNVGATTVVATATVVEVTTVVGVVVVAITTVVAIAIAIAIAIALFITIIFTLVAIKEITIVSAS